MRNRDPLRLNWTAPVTFPGRPSWSSGFDIGQALTTDSNGNIFIAGSSGSDMVPPFGAISDTDAMVAKFDSRGILQWNTRLGGRTPITCSVLLWIIVGMFISLVPATGPGDTRCSPFLGYGRHGGEAQLPGSLENRPISSKINLKHGSTIFTSGQVYDFGSQAVTSNTTAAFTLETTAPQNSS